ncbi:calmodulin-binding protein [Actinidia rufa]|uniref:Calmodulin-binding protein n=1 Tax=Actinidia rufa TaxID=165716 RepID=A0A7J0EU03_9ERIC|nr:calmodulin-binding protein [Actinidia rufa]
MEIEVMIPQQPIDFNFDSACTSPYVTVTSSPHQFGNFFHSTPTTPTRAASIFRQLNTSSASPPSTIPFSWEEKPGTPKTKHKTDQNRNRNEKDFEFDFSGQLQRTSLSADELFDGGKIRPLKPPPQLQLAELGLTDSPRSPKSPRSSISAKIFRVAVSPKHKKIDFDPFEAAIEETRRKSKNPENLGRERTHNSSIRSRSLSPLKVSDIFSENENNSSVQTKTKHNHSSSSSLSSSSSSISASAWRGYKKWKLRELLLFRSASDGRASGEEVKNVSFQLTKSAGSTPRRRGPVSAHEMHYTANQAVSEEMRRKTVLPYKHGLLGCLGFNPSVRGTSPEGLDL